jgi:CheY-like chemotaxis protein
VSISDLAAEISDEYRAIAIEKNAEIRFNADLPVIYGQREKLKHVFRNLMSNSLKYCGNSTPLIEIVRDHTKQEPATLLFKDNGVGIAPGFRERVFDLFTRVPGAGSTESEGVGIGLAIAREVMHRHGGAIEVAPGDTGTTIRLVFGPHAGDASTYDLRGRRLWIVEDDPVLGETLQAHLGETGADARLSRSGEDFLAEINDCIMNDIPLPDAVVLDLGLPGMGGIEVLGRLRASQGTLRSLPVIICSSPDDLQAIAACRELGITEFVAKDGKLLDEPPTSLITLFDCR